MAGKRQQFSTGVFDYYPVSRKGARERKKEHQKLHRVLALKNKDDVTELGAFPKRRFGRGGEKRRRSARGLGDIRLNGIPTTSFTAATAYPYVAGPTLGAAGIYIGQDLHGGGAFCFDPWSAYEQQVISGMSMMLFGQVGTGKSSLAKSMATRQVLAGRKLSVASDKKGEWTKVVRALGGSVIQVGPGMPSRINPLDAGTRPRLNPQGERMKDDEWDMIVRTRRMSIITTMVKILIGRDLDPAEYHAISLAVDAGVKQAVAEGREPVIPDVVEQLNRLKDDDPDELTRAGAAITALALVRMTSGDLGGMFDGPTTVAFDGDAPAVSIDTSSLRGANPEAVRVVNACAGAWTEAMVTTSDGGNRLVIYEEGWDNISSKADLQRMVESWKLARAYGIFNILIMHKIADLEMAGDQGSQMAAMAKSLLADADVKVIYRQDRSALRVTHDEMELSDRERDLLRNLPKGVGLWRVGNSSFEVQNILTEAELPLFDTDERMDMTLSAAKD